MDQQNQPVIEDRRVRITLDPAIAKILIKRKSDLRNLYEGIGKAVESYNGKNTDTTEWVNAQAASGGVKPDEFPHWDYEDGPDGSTYLVMIPAPLPLPDTPQRPQPQQNDQDPETHS